MKAFVNNGLLRVARQASGFSQGDAATKLNIPQVTLSRYENSLSTPTDEFLKQAAFAYDIPIEFFRQPDAVLGAPVSVHPMWRKKKNISTKEMDLIIAELNIRIMHIRRMLLGVDFEPQTKIPKLDIEEYGEDAERIAALVRAQWQIPQGPIQNLTAIMERAGIIIIHSALGGSSVSGVTMSVPGLLPIILLNNEQPSDRARFTLAHELAHLVMHRFPNAEMELQANSFASALLMPPGDIQTAFSGRRIDLERLAALKPEWKVSMQALLYRAQSLGFVDKGQAAHLWRKFSLHRIKLREPIELDFPMEKPGIISQMIKLHLCNFGYSVPEFGQILHFHPHRLKQYYDLSETEKNPSGPKLRLAK
ncbi:MAG: XRE family transcriptional regulator [Nitrospirales bacterium]|nr:ImmA/IrrE family metallo-endopeptidase [Nitrospira sp.]MDR4501474.1 XRE family transcriptional regulator [Nitrospirales bacterium]